MRDDAEGRYRAALGRASYEIRTSLNSISPNQRCLNSDTAGTSFAPSRCTITQRMLFCIRIPLTPEVPEVGTFPFLHNEVDHDSKAEGHDPPGSARPSGKVGLKEGDERCATRLCRSVGERELGVHDSANDNRQSGGLMEGDVLVKGNELIKGCATKER